MARKMKDSGIEWIGEIPEDWEIGKISQLYFERKTKVNDRDFPPLSVTMKGIMPQLSTAAKSDAHDDRKLLCKGDFAINSRSDRRGSCGVSKYDGSVSLINTVLMPKVVLNASFYDWLFHTSMFADEFYKWGHGIVDDLWTTNWQDMKKIQILVPELKEQQRIADFLDQKCAQIDEILQKTRDTIAEYKKLKQSVITQAVTKGVRGERPMKDSGIEWIGEIPEEWGMCRLRFLCSIMTGNQDTQDSNPDGDYPFYVRSPNIERCMKYTFDGPAILMAGDGVGAGKVFHIVEGKYGCHQRVYSMQNIKKIDRKYLFYYLQNKFYIAIETANSKSTVDSVRLPMLQDFSIIIPFEDEQQEIAQYLDEKCAEIDKLIEKKEQLVGELESYKKSLIYEYVTGKKEVVI